LGEVFVFYACFILLSLPFMFVFDDDRVTYHTKADVILGDDGEA